MRLEHLSKAFGGQQVLSELTAVFPEHGLVCVTGASGVGKTTLLRVIAGLEQPDSGEVLDAPERVSILFEDDRLFGWMDALANITLIGANEHEAMSLLEELGLDDKAHARIGQLSAGQARRVALARAFARPARLYLLDEPTARLDEANAGLVVEAILKRAKQALVIASTHDAQLVAACEQEIRL